MYVSRMVRGPLLWSVHTKRKANFRLALLARVWPQDYLYWCTPNSQNTLLHISCKLVSNGRQQPCLWECVCVFVFSSASDWTQNSPGTLALSVISLQSLFFSPHFSVCSWNTFIKSKLKHFQLAETQIHVYSCFCIDFTFGLNTPLNIPFSSHLNTQTK